MVAAEVPSAAWLRSRRDGALYLLRRPGRPTPLKVAQQIQKRMRKQITGAEDLRIRDHVRERMEQPPVVRLRDKVSFMFGVLGCAVLEFVILRQPHDFATCYLLFIIPLLFMRLWMYTKLKWHYFLIDFCYVANAACLLQVLCLPQCVSLIIINYAHASGPLALAIPTWRNSLVFHSVDKITSVFVHTLPALLLFCIRWYPPAGFELPANLEFGRTMASGMLGYVCWQAFYLLHTEVFFRKQLNKQQELMTSIRWLTTPPYSGITLWVHRVVRACGILKPGEMFDSESWKTKMIFISVQLLYTAVTMLPVTWLWSSFYLHVWYLLIILLVCVWNGASYYIEVFSHAYRKQFEGDSSARRAAYLEVMGAPRRNSKPSTPPVGAESGAGTTKEE